MRTPFATSQPPSHATRSSSSAWRRIRTFARRARRSTKRASPSPYLEYGSYFSEWKRRLAIKLWSGWPTFPQVFVRGTLLGGEDATVAALADGSLKQRLG